MDQSEAKTNAKVQEAHDSSDEKWMKYWEKRRQYAIDHIDKEIANMDRVDYSILLQEIEHH